jgi:uncharacterized protein YjbI with pentapeptide repeats
MTRDEILTAVKNGANLSRTNLSYGYLHGANLSGANLSRTNLSYGYLHGANLSGADLSYGYLHGANLSGADLSGANLSGANLSGANLSGANLSGANMRGADLSGANLSGADLSGANLSGANLYDAVLGNQWIIHGPTRSDGYTFFLQRLTQDEMPMIKAGCRHFTISEARAHWQKTRNGTPLGSETFIILDYLESTAAARGLK